MYRVLLVDDEENVLQVLKDSIAWQDMGVEQLFTAQSGEKAAPRPCPAMQYYPLKLAAHFLHHLPIIRGTSIPPILLAYVSHFYYLYYYSTFLSSICIY